MLKIPKYEKTMEKIKSLHLEYLELTALHKPDSFHYCPTTLCDTVQTAIETAESVIKGLEEQDEERQLCTLLPRKTARQGTLPSREGQWCCYRSR